MAISLTAFAQTNVKGVVTDKNGETVTGAMVLNKDNGKWAVTDAAGAFELEGAEKGQNLEITCMGYVDFTVSYKGEATLNIILQDDALQLEETVVIGYGSVRKKDLTGSVGVLNSQLIEQQSTALAESSGYHPRSSGDKVQFDAGSQRVSPDSWSDKHQRLVSAHTRGWNGREQH